MNTYDAIMKAADHVSRNPGLHDFGSPGVPVEGHEKGCPLAWIGYFAQPRVEEEDRYNREATGALSLIHI